MQKRHWHIHSAGEKQDDPRDSLTSQAGLIRELQAGLMWELQANEKSHLNKQGGTGGDLIDL